MTDDALTLLKHAMRERQGAISPVVSEMCRLIDHFSRLSWHNDSTAFADIRALQQENKAMKEDLDRLRTRVFQLETRGDAE